MTTKQQLIADIEILPEHTLRLVSVLVNEIKSMEEQTKSVSESIHSELVHRPPFKFGTMAGKVRMSDDFDAPIDDMKEYME
jgi:hypothetical protein